MSALLSITTKHQGGWLTARRVRFIHQIQSVAMSCWVKSNDPMQFHIVLWQFQMDIYAFCNFLCTPQVSNVYFSRRQLYAEDWVGHCVGEQRSKSVLLWYYTVLHCVTPCETVLYCVTLCNTVWHCVTQCDTVLHFVTLCYTVWHCKTVCMRAEEECLIVVWHCG